MATFVGGNRRQGMYRGRRLVVFSIASMQIVAQIYYYRLRTDQFDTQAAPQNDDEDAEPVSPKARECNARAQFVEVCGMIYSNASSSLL